MFKLLLLFFYPLILVFAAMVGDALGKQSYEESKMR